MCIRVNRNDIETGKAAALARRQAAEGSRRNAAKLLVFSKLPAPSGEYLQHADEEL
jgi:hypothetical protein